MPTAPQLKAGAQKRGGRETYENPKQGVQQCQKLLLLWCMSAACRMGLKAGENNLIFAVFCCSLSVLYHSVHVFTACGLTRHIALAQPEREIRQQHALPITQVQGAHWRSYVNSSFATASGPCNN